MPTTLTGYTELDLLAVALAVWFLVWTCTTPVGPETED